MRQKINARVNAKIKLMPRQHYLLPNFREYSKFLQYRILFAVSADIADDVYAAANTCSAVHLLSATFLAGCWHCIDWPITGGCPATIVRLEKVSTCTAHCLICNGCSINKM